VARDSVADFLLHLGYDGFCRGVDRVVREIASIIWYSKYS
jgi:hypothetical protein